MIGYNGAANPNQNGKGRKFLENASLKFTKFDSTMLRSSLLNIV
jgi:hypothetical protein